MSQEAVDFLLSYYPLGPWTVVADRESAGRRGAWPVCQTSEPTDLLAFIAAHDGSDNLYFTVNLPRLGLKTSPGENEVVAFLGIPLDVDLPAGHSQDDFDALLTRVRGIIPPPTAIVASGGGIQAHWCLTTASPLSDAAKIAALVVALAKELDGDHVQNPNRLMRLPGTMNVLNEKKRSLGRTPAPARLVEADWTRRYPPTIPPPVVPPPASRSSTSLPEPWRERVETGSVTWLTGADRSRSAAVWRITLYLVKAGWADREIATLLVDPELGISGHVLHQSNPPAYAARQVRNARLTVEQDYYRVRKEIAPNRMDNVEKALAQINVSLAYDEFTARISWTNGEDTARARALDDYAVTYLRRTVLQKEKFQPTKEAMWETCVLLARASAQHPLRDYLSSLVHDGTQRLDTWLIRLGDAEDTSYVRAVSRIMLVAAVTRVFAPGVKFDEMLVLENPTQGTDKSTAIRALCPSDEWFTDSLHLDASSKEAIENLTGKWIVEVQELAGMGKRDVERLKAFLSRPTDRARLAYDRAVTEAQRTCVLFGTTNSTRYLRDEQNRRFWPVRVQRMNVEALLAERDQLWAEATAAFHSNASIRLPKELWDMASFEQESRRLDDPWVDNLAEELGDITGRLLTGDAYRILGADRNPALRNQDTNFRVGSAMRELGWEREHARVGGRLAWVYTRGATKEERRRPIHVFRDGITGAITVGRTPAAEEPEEPKREPNDDIPF